MINQILKQRYHIIKKLGEGGIGETFLAEDLDIPINPKPRCVVKRLQPIENEAEIAIIHRLFEKEAQILYKLGKQHPNIPQLYAYFQQDQDFYLIQEYIEGRELIQELIPHQPWTEKQTIDFLKEILSILSYVHQNNVIHRDIKPQNIMRTSDGKLILIDFGSVKEVRTLKLNQKGLTQRTVIIGTKGYMPSEQAMGKPQFSSDLYAVGIIAIQAITGIIDEPLPEEKGEIQWRDKAKVSDSLAEILSTMVRYDFRERYADATVALEAINQMNQPKPIISQKQTVDPAPTKLSSPQESEVKLSSSSPLKWLKRLFKSAEHSSQQTPQTSESSSSQSQGVSVTSSVSSPDVSVNLSTQLYPKQMGQKWGYINQNKHITISPQFDEAKAFSEGLASVKVGKKWGYIDQQGNWVMSPKFDGAESFKDGLAKITLGDKSGYINPQGKVVKAVHSPVSATPQNRLLFPKKINDQYGYVDLNGKMVISPQYADAGIFSEGLASVKIGGKYGYINLAGEIAIAPQFDLAVKFENGTARVMINDQFYQINTKGEII